jgi:hypothetical protein
MLKASTCNQPVDADQEYWPRFVKASAALDGEELRRIVERQRADEQA